MAIQETTVGVLEDHGRRSECSDAKVGADNKLQGWVEWIARCFSDGSCPYLSLQVTGLSKARCERRSKGRKTTKGTYVQAYWERRRSN